MALIALSSQSYAGGDTTLPIEEYEDENVAVKIEPAVTEVEPEIKEVILEDPKIKKRVEKKPATPLKKVLVDKSTPWYAGAGLASGRAKNTYCEDITYGVMAKAGYDFNKYVGVEARGLRTNWEYEGGKLKHLGAFLKPQYPINKAFNLYGLAGYAKTSMGNKRYFSDTGFAYGIGLDYAMNEELGLFVDYEHLLDTDAYDLDALSFGVSYNF